MRKTKLFTTLLLIVLTTLACDALTTPTAAPIPTAIIEVLSTPTAGNIPLTASDVPRVSVEEAKVALDSGAAIIVDVRSRDAYAAEHIASSISLPLAEIETNPVGVKLEKEQWIITYCT